MIGKNNIDLKTLLKQEILEPVFYGDLVYKCTQIMGKYYFIDQYNKIVKHYKRDGYNMDVMRQHACLVVNPVMVNSYGFLFNCMTVS